MGLCGHGDRGKRDAGAARGLIQEKSALAGRQARALPEWTIQFFARDALNQRKCCFRNTPPVLFAMILEDRPVVLQARNHQCPKSLLRIPAVTAGGLWFRWRSASGHQETFAGKPYRSAKN